MKFIKSLVNRPRKAFNLDEQLARIIAEDDTLLMKLAN
jgi:hypothetical protein